MVSGLIYILIMYTQNNPSDNLFRSSAASASGQCSTDLYELSSKNEEYVMPRQVTEMTPGECTRAVCVLTAPMLNLTLPHELQKHWGHVNQNQNQVHSHPIAITNACWIPDITDWWHQKEETQSK